MLFSFCFFIFHFPFSILSQFYLNFKQFFNRIRVVVFVSFPPHALLRSFSSVLSQSLLSVRWQIRTQSAPQVSIKLLRFSDRPEVLSDKKKEFVAPGRSTIQATKPGFSGIFFVGVFRAYIFTLKAFQNAVRRENLFDRLQFAPTFLVCVCFLMLYWSVLNGELVIEGFFTVGRHVSPSWFAVRPRKRIYGRWLVQDWSFFRRLRF